MSDLADAVAALTTQVSGVVGSLEQLAQLRVENAQLQADNDAAVAAVQAATAALAARS